MAHGPEKALPRCLQRAQRLLLLHALGVARARRLSKAEGATAPDDLRRTEARLSRPVLGRLDLFCEMTLEVLCWERTVRESTLVPQRSV
jgi:hypothetical protein